MRYEVWSGDELINTIVASEEFAEKYAASTGYTLIHKETDPTPTTPITTEYATYDELAAAYGQGVNEA